jgi:hypothetical protein
VSRKNKIIVLVSSAVVLFLILLIPLESNLQITEGDKKPFIWNRDSLWNSLELEFRNAFVQGCGSVSPRLDSLLNDSEMLLDEISSSSLDPDDYRFRLLGNNIFKTGPLIPVCSHYFPQYISFYSKLRRVVKEQSVHWDMNSAEARNTLYQLLYGNRTAIEEIMLQLPEDQVDPLIKGVDEPSLTPSAEILGVKVHSGDILVSRGGAPTSALIARGNDYPGNFSHIAFVHVDAATNRISIIESHIERGVAVSTPEDYMNDIKLRIMVLRLRYDLIEDDPMLPHKAAEYSLGAAGKRHIPYDFEMDFNNSEKQFCSEVASSAYRNYGVTLWKGLSAISSKGTRNWLGAFGVRHFETEGPTDLEYDPQLSVVAEWRDPETLYKDHLDNAVTDVMLEEADSGRQLTYDWYLLPAARVMKLYSSMLNLFGGVGPVPEGMSAEAALKNKKYSETHETIKQRAVLLAEEFKTANGYTPPYWVMVNLARNSKFIIQN